MSASAQRFKLADKSLALFLEPVARFVGLLIFLASSSPQCKLTYMTYQHLRTFSRQNVKITIIGNGTWMPRQASELQLAKQLERDLEMLTIM